MDSVAIKVVVRERLGYVHPWLARTPENHDELWRYLSASFAVEGLKELKRNICDKSIDDGSEKQPQRAG